MARRVNIMMDEGLVARDPEAAARYSLPRRERGDPGVVGRCEETDASAKMDALRSRLPAVDTDQIVRRIREEREA